MKLELTEKETLALFDLVKFAIDKNLVDRNVIQTALASSSSQDVVEKDTPSVQPPPQPSQVEFVSFPEPTLSNHQSKGRKHMKELLRFWLPNFREENKEQQDRGAYMNDLGIDGVKAGSVISYCMAVGGLTKAIWNLAQEMDEFGDHKRDQEWIRYLAGHITQVASCHLGHLADEMEYPNPLLFLTREL